MARFPETIAARGILSRWYGPDSIVCDTVTRLNESTAEAKFKVGQNLCSLTLRPPMFDRLKIGDGGFTTQTSDRDAWQHFIGSIGVKVIPGHNITGLVAEALAQGLPSYQLTGFDYIRFKGFVLPGQEISFSATAEEKEAAVCATLTMRGEKRTFTKNFQVEEDLSYIKARPQLFLAKHWLFEHHAQGLGMVGLRSSVVNPDVVPVLMEAGKSYFPKGLPILAGDTLKSVYKILAVDDQQVFGDAETYIGYTLVAQQKEILLQFVSMEQIQAVIERKKQ